MTDNGFQAALQGVVVDKQQSVEQQKEVIEEMKAQYDRNDDRISEMMDVFFELKDARDNIIEDEEQDLFDKSVNVCNGVIENIEELDFVEDLAKSEDVVKKQVEIIRVLKKEIEEMGDLVDMEVTFDNKNKGSDKEGATNVDNTSRELSWHEVKTEAEKHAKDNLMIGDTLEDIKKAFSDRSSVIDKLKKGEEKSRLIEELKDFKIKETKRLYKIIQERNAVLQQQESRKKEVLKELGGPGTVYAEKKGSYRRIQIVKYSEGFGQVTYSEDGKKESVALDEFREVIGGFESNKFYVPIKIEREFHIGKALESGAENKKEFPTIRVERYVANDKQLVVKKFVGQKGEFVTMTEDELRTLIKDGEYAVQVRKQKNDSKSDADGDSVDMDKKDTTNESIQAADGILDAAQGIMDDKNLDFDQKRRQMEKILYVGEVGKWIPKDKDSDLGDMIIKGVDEQVGRAVVEKYGIEKTLHLFGDETNLIPTLQSQYEFVQGKNSDDEDALFNFFDFDDELNDDSRGNEDDLDGDESIAGLSSDKIETGVEISGIEQLSDKEQEIIEHIFLVVQDAFDKVDQNDENAIQHFWKTDVSKFIREENGESLKESVQIIANITKVLKENLVKIDDTKNVRSEAEIATEIEEIFNSEEIQEYIGEGESKKVQGRRDLIQKYKKEIIGAIVEKEHASGSAIDQDQFVIDFLRVHKPSATAVRGALEQRSLNLQSSDEGEIEKSDEELGEIQKTRDVADITFAQMKKHGVKNEALNADSIEDGDERFKKITRETWKEFAVRGFLYKDKKTNEIKVNESLNPDCRVSLWLLRQAGIDTNDVNFVAPGDLAVGRINIDTGGKDGIHVMDDYVTTIIDHHGSKSNSDTSAAEKMYESMMRLGLVEKTDSIDRLISFINDVDNFDYPNADKYFKNYFKNSWKTMLGMHKKMTAEEMFDFFEYGKNKGQKKLSPTQELSSGLLKRFKLDVKDKHWHKFTKVENQRRLVKRREKELQKLQRNGFIIDSEKYGKICVDTGNDNGNGFTKVDNESARAFGCDTYLIWDKADNGFFLSSLVGKPIEDEFAQGKNVRGTMFIKAKSVDEPIMQLRDMLDEMTDGKLEPLEKLEGVLKDNGEHFSDVVREKLGENIEKILGNRVQEFHRRLDKGADWTGMSKDKKKETMERLTKGFIKDALETLDAGDAVLLKEVSVEKVYEYLIDQVK